MRTPDPDVARIARRQHGLLTATQAHEAGLTDGEIRHRRRTGRWVDVSRGLYGIAGCPFTWHTKVMAACLISAGVASHRTAAVLHEVRGFRPGQPEITVARPRRARRRLAIVHHSHDLDSGHVVVVSGIPTTGPARLFVDLGAVVAFTTYERAVDDLVARRLLTWDQALESWLRHSRQGRNGAGPARALLAERYGDEVPESVLERVFLHLVTGAGLPRPVPQFELHDSDGFVARVDFAYPDHRVAVELDSRRYHLHADAFESDRWKRNRLQGLGWRVLQYTWRQVLDTGPDVVAQVRAHLV